MFPNWIYFGTISSSLLEALMDAKNISIAALVCGILGIVGLLSLWFSISPWC